MRMKECVEIPNPLQMSDAKFKLTNLFKSDRSFEHRMRDGLCVRIYFSTHIKTFQRDEHAQNQGQNKQSTLRYESCILDCTKDLLFLNESHESHITGEYAFV